jgi:nucleolin
MSKIATPIFASSSSMQMRSVRTVANATLSKSFVGSAQRSFMNVNAFNQRGLLMSTEAYDAESPAAESESSGGEVKLYIGNLSWDMDDQALNDLFSQYQASDCVIVTDRNTGRSRGFGFATVPSQEMADSAIAALNDSDQFGRQMRVVISLPPEERPAREQRPRRNWDADGRKVYFGNLSWGMDHLDLQDLCAEFGNVDESRLITDRETGRSRGFGFVTMSSEKEAEDVVAQLNGQDVDGRVLRVNIATSNKDGGGGGGGY